MTTTSNSCEQLAEEALQQARTQLMLAFRFMDAALWRMPLEPAEVEGTVATDGRTLWFSPLNVLRSFREHPAELARDVLHAVLHCLLRHPFDGTHEHARTWWLACDMAVEEMARQMAADQFPSAQDTERAEAVRRVWDGERALTPEHLYGALEPHLARLELHGSDKAASLEALEVLFRRDDHQWWPQQTPEEEQRTAVAQQRPSERALDSDEAGAEGLSSQDVPDEDVPVPTEAAAGGQAEDAQTAAPSAGAQQSAGGAGAGLADGASDDAEQAWEDISKRVQEDLETYARSMSGRAECLLANVAIQNRAVVDYADFLRRFATRGEDMRINDEEFDYVSYTYGMDLYGDMPLIEPLEYQETRRVREFVIALDTSASCSGELVQEFVSRTFQILQQSEHWGSRVNIHVVQCDDKVRQVTHVDSLDQLHELVCSFKVQGMGGTDFRPVFAYVDEMMRIGEFEDLRGLIYFTDGYGTFPQAPPPYDAAFVFIEDEGQARDVPPWAMKVVLRGSQLKML